MKQLALTGHLLLFCTLPVSESLAQEGVITLRSTVKGNQEQPKVMYVLPWQAAESMEVEYHPDNQWLSDVFDPVDRDEFIRELNYRQAFSSVPDAPSATTK